MVVLEMQEKPYLVLKMNVLVGQHGKNFPGVQLTAMVELEDEQGMLQIIKIVFWWIRHEF